MLLLQTFLLLLIAILFVPVAVLLLQVLSAVFAKHFWYFKTVKYAGERPTVAIIIPAHNESLGISATLNSLMPQLTKGDRLIVVADNCNDKTAEVARSHDAEVLERTNLDLRGKGYALDHAIQFLKANPPQIAMIIDADCVASANLVEVLAHQCMQTQKPIQANYSMHFPSADSLKKKIMEFAWVMKNKVRPSGYQRLGLPCQLMGTGMAFVWQDLAQSQLASSHLVEDMKLGLDLARAGKAPQYCAEASVTSLFPMSEEGVASQRARWEHGHLGVIVEEAPKLIMQAIKTGNIKLMIMGLELIVPPLALLMLLVLGLCVLSFVYFVVSTNVLPFSLTLVLLAALGLSTLLAWNSFATHILSFKDLLGAPFILLAKIPLYIKFLVNRQVDWVRSKRDNTDA